MCCPGSWGPLLVLYKDVMLSVEFHVQMKDPENNSFTEFEACVPDWSPNAHRVFLSHLSAPKIYLASWSWTHGVCHKKYCPKGLYACI